MSEEVREGHEPDGRAFVVTDDQAMKLDALLIGLVFKFGAIFTHA
jgi:hypothetical protein